MTPAAPRWPALTLYTRAGCHLCEQAAAHLQEAQLPFTPVDVDQDPPLQERYSHDVPVLTRARPGGEQLLAKGAFSRARVQQLKLLLLRDLP